jgi:hypothetical protein
MNLKTEPRVLVSMLCIERNMGVLAPEGGTAVVSRQTRREIVWSVCVDPRRRSVKRADAVL